MNTGTIGFLLVLIAVGVWGLVTYLTNSAGKIGYDFPYIVNIVVIVGLMGFALILFDENKKEESK